MHSFANFPDFCYLGGPNHCYLKKTVAIFLLMIFLFNVGGYHLLFWSLRLQAKKDLLHRLDAEQYASEEFVVLSLPITLPYLLHQPDFTPAHGEVEFKGQFYSMVKQMVKGDTLYMICIKDRNRSQLETTFAEYTNLASDIPLGFADGIDVLSKLYKDYTFVEMDALYLPFTITSPTLSGPTDFMAASPLIQVESPPPQLEIKLLFS